MRQEIKLVIGLLVLAGLGGAIYAVQQDDAEHLEAHAESNEELPTLKLTKDQIGTIDKVVVKNKDKGEVTLEKKDNIWRVTAPVDAKANQENVTRALDTLEKLEVEALIATREDVYEKYELDEVNSVHVQLFAGGTSLMNVHFGKSGSRGNMARMGDAASPAVYAVKGFQSYQFARELKNWRFNEIMAFEDTNVVAVEVENKNGKFSFTKEGEDWKGVLYARNDEGELADKSKKLEEIDSQKVKDMIRAYKNLKATNFAEEGDDTGIDAAVDHGGIIRFTMKDDDAPSHVVKVGKTQEGSNRFLAKEGDDTVYVISSWAADWASANTDKFKKKEQGAAGVDVDEAVLESEGDGDFPLPPMLDHGGDDGHGHGKGDGSGSGKGDGSGSGDGSGKGKGKVGKVPTPPKAPLPPKAPPAPSGP